MLVQACLETALQRPEMPHFHDTYIPRRGLKSNIRLNCLSVRATMSLHIEFTGEATYSPCDIFYNMSLISLTLAHGNDFETLQWGEELGSSIALLFTKCLM